MGTTDYGTQKLSFDYNQDATGKLFNNVNFQLVPTGIYSGFTLSKLANGFVSTATTFLPVANPSTSVTPPPQKQSRIISSGFEYDSMR